MSCDECNKPTPGGWTIVHGGQVITLNGPASQDLVLQGDMPGGLVLAWEPKNRDATDLEVRARIVSTNLAIGEVPIVRWYTETGHGDTVWSEPQPSLPVIAGTQMLKYSLPARGMQWRTTARQFRIGFENQGTIVGGPLTLTTVQISFLPTWGAERGAARPYQHLAVPFAGVQQPFPMNAREFQIYDVAGAPLAPAAVAILYTGINGALFGPVDAATLADFRPIPHDAASWTPAAAVVASYR